MTTHMYILECADGTFHTGIRPQIGKTPKRKHTKAHLLVRLGYRDGEKVKSKRLCMGKIITHDCDTFTQTRVFLIKKMHYFCKKVYADKNQT